MIKMIFQIVVESKLPIPHMPIQNTTDRKFNQRHSHTQTPQMNKITHLWQLVLRQWSQYQIIWEQYMRIAYYRRNSIFKNNLKSGKPSHTSTKDRIQQDLNRSVRMLTPSKILDSFVGLILHE